MLEIVHGQVPGFLELAVLGREGFRLVETHHLLPSTTYVALSKFRMETITFILTSIPKEDFMFLIDVEDAHFHIHIHQESKSFLWFIVSKRIHQLKALYFGLSSSSQVFTTVFALILKWVNQRGICLLQCWDDWLVATSSLPHLLEHHNCAKNWGVSPFGKS